MLLAILEWCGRHPFLTFIILMLLSGAIKEVRYMIRGKDHNNENPKG